MKTLKRNQQKNKSVNSSLLNSQDGFELKETETKETEKEYMDDNIGLDYWLNSLDRAIPKVKNPQAQRLVLKAFLNLNKAEKIFREKGNKGPKKNKELWELVKKMRQRYASYNVY